MNLLAREIDAYYDGFPHARALLDALRVCELVVPLADDGRPLCVTDRGLTWVCAFTSTDRLARFAVTRGEGEREWSYTRVRGALLLEQDSGIAVDLGSRRPMVLPAGAAA